MGVLHWRKNGAILSAGILAVTLCGCGNSKNNAPEYASTQEEVQDETDATVDDYVASGVQLPADFENMVYPIEAVMVECYSQGLPYYKKGEDPMSFWFSMAVLSSLMTDDGVITPDIEDEFCIYDAEEIQLFASTLYHGFASGKFTLPDTEEDDPYVSYDDETGFYGLLDGNVGDLIIYITGCTGMSDGYIIDAELLSGDSEGILSEFQVKIKPSNMLTRQGSISQDSNTEETGNSIAHDLFSYSICSVEEMTEDFSEDNMLAEEEMTEQSEDISESGDDADSKKTDVSEGSAEDQEDSTERAAADFGMGPDLVTEDEAMLLAKDYLGDEAKCNYKRMVTIGNYVYYDFSIKDADISSTDILVCADGSDVVTGIENADGSWSFDQ